MFGVRNAEDKKSALGGDQGGKAEKCSLLLAKKMIQTKATSCTPDTLDQSKRVGTLHADTKSIRKGTLGPL